ncbi:MAG: thioredoxin family protein [Bacteroidales bacterium]|nr:thioredoxin family protein [Bacteroidales bacterium]MCF8456855.1 thioredoxin family protein [Bacteroidales bacterium]
MKRAFIITIGLLFTLSTFAQTGYKVGDMARGFELKNIDSEMFSLRQFKSAKGYVIIFTCNHCRYAKAYEDRIIAIDQKYKKLGYPVVAVNPNDSTIEPDDSYSKMIERATEKGFTFPYLLDADQSVFKRFGATKTPHVFVMSRGDEGLKIEYIGTIDDNYADASEVKVKYLENALDALLAGEKPDPNFTKAIGCSIKYKKD